VRTGEQMNVGIVGARGVVGAQLVESLSRRDFPAEHLRLFGAELDEVAYEDDTVTVEAIGPDAFKSLQVLVLATPAAVAKPLAQVAQQQGVWVADISGAHRLDNAIPLVAPGVNNSVLDKPFRGRIVSIASAEAIALSQVLFPVQAAYGLLSVECTMLLSSSHFGKAGVETLSKQSASLLNGIESSADPFVHRLAFNMVPGVGPFESEHSESERRLMVETVRLLSGQKMPGFSTTSVLVPAFHGSLLVLSLLVEQAVSREDVTALFRKDSALKVVDDLPTQVVPTSLLSHDDSTVHVGRIRASGQRIQLVASVDNAFLLADRTLDIAFELAERE
jgi:aspartate-semialdehyde dehydrogenase